MPWDGEEAKVARIEKAMRHHLLLRHLVSSAAVAMPPGNSFGPK